MDCSKDKPGKSRRITAICSCNRGGQEIKDQKKEKGGNWKIMDLISLMGGWLGDSMQGNILESSITISDSPKAR